MTDFAKEARDLPDFAEETYAITAVFRGEHMDDAAMTVIDRRVTDALRRMYAEGVAEGMAKAAEIALPDIEAVSAKVHEAWIAAKLAAGVTSRRSESGEELMRPYEKLSGPAKDLDRNTVRAVYAAILAAAPPGESKRG